MRPEALCRVTMLEPYPGGKVSLGYGQESRVPFDGVMPTDEDFSHPDRCGALGTDNRDPRNRRSPNYAVPIVFELDYADPNMRSVDIPVACAKLHFGDWTIAPGAERSLTRLTYAQEKMRVAFHWGDYKYPRQVQKGDVDKRVIGVPRMPKVSIQMLDERTHTPLERTLLPHVLWSFEEDIDQDAVAEVRRRGQATGQMISEPTIDVSKLSLADLERLRDLLKPPKAPKKTKR